MPAILGTLCLICGIRARRTEKGGRKAAPDRPVGAGEGKKKRVHVPSCWTRVALRTSKQGMAVIARLEICHVLLLLIVKLLFLDA